MELDLLKLKIDIKSKLESLNICVSVYLIILDLLVNLENLESLILDRTNDEYICDLGTEKSIILSLEQKGYLFSHITCFL